MFQGAWKNRMRFAGRAVKRRERRAPAGSRGGGEGFFEDGLEEVGGVGARVRQLRRQQSAAPQQRFHSRHDRRLLRQRR
jgi:hypothetical protein